MSGKPRLFKRCADCGEEKPVSHFPRNRSRKSGRHHHCGACNNRRSAAWQKANKGHIAAWRLEWRAKSPRHALLVTLRGALKRRPCARPVAIDELMGLFEYQNGKCALSGIPLTWAKGRVMATSITLDRIDHRRGYVKDNVRLVAHAVNSFRGTMSDDEMFAMAVALVLNLGPQRKELGKVTAVDFTQVSA